MHRDLGNYDQAIQLAQTALIIAEGSGYRREQALILASLGLAYQKKGDLEKALMYQNRAIERAKTIGDPEVNWRLFGEEEILIVY